MFERNAQPTSRRAWNGGASPIVACALARYRRRALGRPWVSRSYAAAWAKSPWSSLRVRGFSLRLGRRLNSMAGVGRVAPAVGPANLLETIPRMKPTLPLTDAGPKL